MKLQIARGKSKGRQVGQIERRDDRGEEDSTRQPREVFAEVEVDRKQVDV